VNSSHNGPRPGADASCRASLHTRAVSSCCPLNARDGLTSRPRARCLPTGTVPTCLRWPHGGKTAYICGSFTQWQKMPMQWRQTGASGEWFKVGASREPFCAQDTPHVARGPSPPPPAGVVPGHRHRHRSRPSTSWPAPAYHHQRTTTSVPPPAGQHQRPLPGSAPHRRLLPLTLRVRRDSRRRWWTLRPRRTSTSLLSTGSGGTTTRRRLCWTTSAT
jgi:hypothetical protein